MRFFPFVLLPVLCGAAVAQDSTQLALQVQQQQMLQQQLAQQQLTQQQQLSLINQQQLMQDTNAGLAGYRLRIRAPRLQTRVGPDAGTVVVQMEDASRGASIFYTTDGWTPTAASERYVGPIIVQQNVTVRAIALVAGGLRSYVSVLPAAGTPMAPGAQGPSAVHVQQLDTGTKLPLLFASAVTSRGQKVGDRLPVLLAEDLFVDGKLVAAKGSAIETVVTHIDNSRVTGLPGVLSFSARSIRLQDGTVVHLLGVETMEGADETKKAGIVSLIPFGGLAVHGGDAVITAGARFEAEVKKPVT